MAAKRRPAVPRAATGPSLFDLSPQVKPLDGIEVSSQGPSRPKGQHPKESDGRFRPVVNWIEDEEKTDA